MQPILRHAAIYTEALRELICTWIYILTFFEVLSASTKLNMHISRSYNLKVDMIILNTI